MKSTIYTVNDNGLNQIHQFLADHHKKGMSHFDKDMLRAWATDAEFQLAEGNPASIELKHWESLSGHTETFTINTEGLDAEEINIEE